MLKLKKMIKILYLKVCIKSVILRLSEKIISHIYIKKNYHVKSNAF
jgi:hypothetical protein